MDSATSVQTENMHEKDMNENLNCNDQMKELDKETSLRKHCHLEKDLNSKQTVSHPCVQSDSDVEWEQIAAAIDGQVESAKQIGTKNMQSNKYQNTQINTKNVDRRPQLKLVTSTREKDRAMQTRGEVMIEKTQLFTTPVRIEFNLDTTINTFNIINAATELFSRMQSRDEKLRVLHHNSNDILWEKNIPLPEDKEFLENFRLRDQTFRKGTKKITIHCIIESILTINNLKYMEPLRTYIFDNNIWIKPDYYKAKTVGSPGFITLIHPKMTNKNQLVHEIKDMISQIKVNVEEAAVKEWYRRNQIEEERVSTPTPTVHVEVNLRNRK